MEKITFEPIGIVRANKKYRYETPRQAVLAERNKAVIELNSGNNFEQALSDLEGFDRLWVLYLFHLNSNWKPKVSPPFYSGGKIGVFATRAPYRPNPIGMSCVKLIKVENLKLYIEESDILDGSPVIDIKPYLPYSDSFPECRTGWAETAAVNKFQIIIESEASEQLVWLEKNGSIYLEDFIRLQLETNPEDNRRKRICKSHGSGPEAGYILAYRTWRINFTVSKENSIVKVISVGSGYSADDLKEIADDKYNDKLLHILFNRTF